MPGDRDGEQQGDSGAGGSLWREGFTNRSHCVQQGSYHKRPLGDGIEHILKMSYPIGKEVWLFIFQLFLLRRDIAFLGLPKKPSESVTY